MPRTKVMVERALLKEFGARDGVAVVGFEDGHTLRLVPEWCGDSVRRIVDVVLEKDGIVLARVVDGRFWPGGIVTQTDLGAYCRFAIDLERDVYRHYRQKKIAEDAWRVRFRAFWKIVIKSRGLTTALEQAQLPVWDAIGKP